MPSGLVLSTIGLLFLGLSVGMCSDRSLVVLTRRELAAFFYSPVAYFVLLGFSLMGWFAFWIFIRTLFSHAIRTMQPVEEPIVAYYLWSFIPVVILVLLGIPVLTMRLLSEEQRTGTLEVLLTVPLSETSIVISKFLAVFILYLVLWLPWGLFLIALRVEGGQPFEYRPLLSFLMALASTGAGFLAMGLFFSSLTRNQIISAVLTALGILFFTLPGLMGDAMRQGASADSVWNTVLTHISYVDYWHSSLREGLLSPKFALFHLSAAVFWLFLTVKVLESRKWR
jgi:ABC-type transport system involved in multi-copper enzyme maturation permease subunit